MIHEIEFVRAGPLLATELSRHVKRGAEPALIQDFAKPGFGSEGIPLVVAKECHVDIALLNRSLEPLQCRLFIS